MMMLGYYDNYDVMIIELSSSSTSSSANNKNASKKKMHKNYQCGRAANMQQQPTSEIISGMRSKK